MAITFANKTIGSATSVAAGTTASLSPVGNKLYLASVISRTSLGAGTQPNQPTITGGGLTWVAVGSSAYDNTSSSRKSLTMLRGMVTNPTSAPGTIDFGGQTQTDVVWVIDEVSGVDSSGTNGSGAVVQVVSGSAPTAGTNTVSGTLSAFASTANATYASFGEGNGTTLTPGASLTAVARGTNGLAITMLTAQNAGNVGTVTATDAANSELGVVGIEIKANPVTQLVQSSGTAVLGLGSTSAVWANNTTTGNLVVVGVTLTNAAVLGTVSSVTDAQSNIYTKAASGTLSSIGDVLDVEMWYSANITGGAGSVIVNHTIDNCAMFVREYSTFNTLDVVGSASGSSTAPNSGTQTTTQATELIVIATGDDKGATQTWTPAGAFQDMVGTATTITGISMEDKVVTSTGAQTGTLTLGASANWDSLIGTFYQLVSSGAVTFKTLMGVGQV